MASCGVHDVLRTIIVMIVFVNFAAADVVYLNLLLLASYCLDGDTIWLVQCPAAVGYASCLFVYCFLCSGMGVRLEGFGVWSWERLHFWRDRA